MCVCVLYVCMHSVYVCMHSVCVYVCCMCVCVCMCVVCVHAYLPLGSHHDEFPQDSTLLWGACSCLHVQWGGVADTPGRERRGGGEERR